MPDAAAPGATYTFTLTVTDKDGERESDDTTVAVLEAPVENRAPALMECGNTTREVPENGGASVNVGATITAKDPDGNTLIYTLAGNGAAFFAMGISTGQLTTKFGVDYDYETQSTYALTVSAADGNKGTTSIAVIVRLTDVNEAPAFNDGSHTLQAAAENSGGGIHLGAAGSATHPDGNTLAYSLSGMGAGSLAINAATGN